MNHAERLAALKKAQGLDNVQKSAIGPYTTNPSPGQGYQAYNLDQVVVHYFNTYVPLLALLPREGGQNGSGANWKLVRRLKNVADWSGVPEGARGQIVQIDQVDRYEPFCTLSKDQRVTVEASLASQGLQPDAQASASQSLTEEFLTHEHKNILNGIRTDAIAQPTIVGTAAAGGGSFAAGDFDVAVAPLSFEAWENYMATGLLPATVALTLADGTAHTYNAGVGKASAVDTVTVAASGVIKSACTADLKAAGYAWFIGANGSDPKLAGVSNIASFTFTGSSASGIVASSFAVDHSANDLTMNGIISQISRAGSGATLVDLDGQTLTATASGSIVEFDATIKAMWKADRVVPTKIFVSADVADEINQVLLSAGAGTGAMRVMPIRNADGNIEAGTVVSTYRSPIPAMQKVLEIVPLADLAPGIVLFYCDQVQGATPTTRSPTAMLLAQDYILEVYAKTRRTYELGLSTIGTVAVRYGAAWGALYNVKL